MRSVRVLSATAVLLAGTAVQAAGISGEYLEARTCDVYTGPCFANAEMDLAGKEAVMAWKVDEGSWNGVSLSGLGAAIVLKAEGTLGFDGVFPMRAGKVKSVILVDENATTEQQDALVAFVKESAGELAQDVLKVVATSLTLQNDHLAGKGVFQAGELAKIETRGLKKGDCVCTNELIFYQPLSEVENFSPAYTDVLSYQGDGLDSQWTNRRLRSAFLATFRR